MNQVETMYSMLRCRHVFGPVHHSRFVIGFFLPVFLYVFGIFPAFEKVTNLVRINDFVVMANNEDLPEHALFHGA